MLVCYTIPSNLLIPDIDSRKKEKKKRKKEEWVETF